MYLLRETEERINKRRYVRDPKGEDERDKQCRAFKSIEALLLEMSCENTVFHIIGLFRVLSTLTR